MIYFNIQSALPIVDSWPGTKKPNDMKKADSSGRIQKLSFMHLFTQYRTPVSVVLTAVHISIGRMASWRVI